MQYNRNQWAATGLCAVLVVVCVAMTHPVADVGIADDFSYAKSAEVLAKTGHLVYNGWSTAMLGWQLYWGALFYRVFGYTWFAIRLSGLVMAVLTTGLLHRILLRCGLTPRNAFLGTLAVALSPIFLPLAYGFMSDMFGLFILLACLYCCLRALEAYEQALSTAVLIGWLALTTVIAVVGGTTRQISWVGVLTLMPTAAWMMRRRRSILPTALVLWTVGFGSIVALLHWFQAQPYSLREQFFAMKPDGPKIANFISNLGGGSLEMPFLVLPVALGFLFYVPWRERRTRVIGSVMAVGVLVYAAVRLHQHILRDSLLPTLQGVLSDRGLWFIQSAELEWWPIVLDFVPRLLVSGITLGAIFAVVATLVGRKPGAAQLNQEPSQERWVPSLRALVVLLLPTIIAYACLLLPRTMFSILFDRYLLWFMVMLTLLGLRYTQQWQPRSAQRRAQLLAACTVVALAAYGMLAMHDLFAMYRARLAAIAVLRDAGVARTKIRGGFEYNATTEIEVAGHVNSALMNPVSAYVLVPGVVNWQDDMFWHVKPEYQIGVAYVKDECRSDRPVVRVGNLIGPALSVTTMHLKTWNWAQSVAPCPDKSAPR